MLWCTEFHTQFSCEHKLCGKVTQYSISICCGLVASEGLHTTRASRETQRQLLDAFLWKGFKM